MKDETREKTNTNHFAVTMKAPKGAHGLDRLAEAIETVRRCAENQTAESDTRVGIMAQVYYEPETGRMRLVGCVIDHERTERIAAIIREGKVRARVPDTETQGEPHD
jgi:hypothetical protein